MWSKLLLWSITLGFFLTGFTNLHAEQEDIADTRYISEHTPPTQTATTLSSTSFIAPHVGPLLKSMQECSTQNIQEEKTSDLAENIPTNISLYEENTKTLNGKVIQNNLSEDATEPLFNEQSFVEENTLQNTAFVLELPMSPRIDLWIDRYCTNLRMSFEKSLYRFDQVIPVMEKIFEEAGLPKDLVYLSLIESGGKCNAKSRAGAVGYWQFMPGTAKRYGLRVDKWVDERRNLEKSTLAATNYLKNLYSEFNDWFLACAAYNSGEGKIRRLMTNHPEVASFWDIDNSMPIKNETLNFVPKFLAALTIGKNREVYGLGDGINAELPDYEEITAPPMLFFNELADATGVDSKYFSELNPELIRGCTPPSSKEYTLKVPVGIKELLRKYLEQRQERYNEVVTHTTKKGDTLYGIARRYNSSVDKIAHANNMRIKDILPIGKTLMIPTTEIYTCAETKGDS